jgi:UDP-N-acetyl-D-mannosaminuronate dehydrogenase
MSCDTSLDGGRPISIMDGGVREEGVVYPGEELVLVESTSPNGTVEQMCSMNECSSEISESGNYTVSLNITMLDHS